MRLVADESVDGGIVRALRAGGHHVVYVAEMASGISDPEVLALANDARAPLLTADSDFGELVFRQGHAHPGVILLRLSGLSSTDKVRLVLAMVSDHGSEMQGAFSVLSPTALRIRGER